MQNETASQAAQTIMESPKVAATVSAITTVIGGASMASWIQGWLSVVATGIGILLSLALLRNHWIKSKILQRELEKANEK
jgi:hypothetical protein